ncbi:hypothetical protein GLOIN_2v573242 [Rhizophagus irregularis DAOM 181602=DAOM 197198]|uniref:Uncharacterized protein n=1 Tax=Rhizophagus irregularis (strain DAOM 181602 / DAOM 197198 / MUCL 43194) TaxID=747089 RepID=A0A2P4PCK2_RHIID|nr:hypothetical protein GLOIN_2v573242 [Rhizophagus irregularis DAOM 181602=DAOM 197198]POG63100.1 hypothetical protein GLOIN_2v573242 [Rhizophagus irregularis DAOM 181602=DAOM 197198]GET61213.1 hypothetical protein GLOIN_2v573242 [Rhizophagus irregularis DAOM 181602=DAOM 197198]|eukprot:XP_025169966.1 hypothetical protein GLOIN_2v573242 [Rhizophagus irregularis DAOM 181602=DAOM 197198]
MDLTNDQMTKSLQNTASMRCYVIKIFMYLFWTLMKERKENKNSDIIKHRSPGLNSGNKEILPHQGKYGLLPHTMVGTIIVISLIISINLIGNKYEQYLMS